MHDPCRAAPARDDHGGAGQVIWLLASDIGDPDAWPEAIAYSVIAICVAVCVIALLKWGDPDK